MECYQSTLWSTLLAASSLMGERDAEGPLPPFGWSITDWSPDLRETYSAETATSAGSAAALISQPELALLYRDARIGRCKREAAWAGRMTGCRP
jgi:hypothetical protein